MSHSSSAVASAAVVSPKSKEPILFSKSCQHATFCSETTFAPCPRQKAWLSAAEGVERGGAAAAVGGLQARERRG